MSYGEGDRVRYGRDSFGDYLLRPGETGVVVEIIEDERADAYLEREGQGYVPIPRPITKAEVHNRGFADRLFPHDADVLELMDDDDDVSGLFDYAGPFTRVQFEDGTEEISDYHEFEPAGNERVRRNNEIKWTVWSFVTAGVVFGFDGRALGVVEVRGTDLERPRQPHRD